MDIAQQKKILRKEIRERLRVIDSKFRTSTSEHIVNGIIASSWWQQAQHILLFSPIGWEPDIESLFSHGLSAGKKVYFPRVTGETLEIQQIVDAKELLPGSFGILEPQAERSIVVDAAVIDLILVPGLAFDSSGYRLGRGKGYYDRLLASVPNSVTMGVFYARQQVSKVPVEEHDIRLQVVVTELSLISS